MTQTVETNRYRLPIVGDPFLMRDGTTEGRVVGYRDCTLEGCRGTRIGVRWPDGKLTWPCSKGCTTTHGGIWKVAP